MTYTVYGAAGSGSVPVEAALTLIGAPYRVVEAVTWEGDAERDKVAVVNPMRQIPALITPAGETITESAAILIWLAEQHPEAALGPEPCDPRRAQFLRWMCFVPAAVYSMYWVRDDPARLAGADPAAQALIRTRTAERIADCWAKMESQIVPDRFLLGPEPTVLDLYVAVASRWTPHRRRFHEVAPRMGAVMRRVDALPELEAFWAERFPLTGRYGG
ncbi:MULTISPECIES: glutathione S-transferase family protein [unclassified Brevundimonas]|uniref:glutathione S-transferase family protein n=1 Tax=unclassified Brevundimonas TaxID=2622653 RepID=UPI0006F36570|nr:MULTISPECIES: glutathione S-transferase family protein [unclassified Brevundimonas]KQY79243.1 glutathione S-transferase [Brevundimonas sp. Root1423]KRA28559.1 glutathione S-transferase [Brevundimonas sp. Root608]